MYLRIMVEIYLFHSLVILYNSATSDSEAAAGEAIVYRNELYQLIKGGDNVPPSDFCREVLYAYEMHDEALMLIYHKKEYAELMHLLKGEVEKAVNEVKSGQGSIQVRQYWVKKLVKYARKINCKQLAQ